MNPETEGHIQFFKEKYYFDFSVITITFPGNVSLLRIASTSSKYLRLNFIFNINKENRF
jgi:hypothetical protein